MLSLCLRSGSLERASEEAVGLPLVFWGELSGSESAWSEGSRRAEGPVSCRALSPKPQPVPGTLDLGWPRASSASEQVWAGGHCHPLIISSLDVGCPQGGGCGLGQTALLC